MEFLIVILLILLNGLFSMSEVALISARKSSLKIQAAEGSKAAKTALRLAEDPDRFLSTVQIGITLIGLLTGMYSGETFAEDLGAIFVRWGIPAAYAVTLAKMFIVIVVTYLTIVFGELVPKRIGMSMSESVAKLLSRPMHRLSQVASPFVWILSKSIEIVTSLLRLKESESTVTEAEIKSIIQEGAEYGEVQEVEQRIVGRVFSLGDRTVGSIMTHRSDLVWLNVNMSADQIRSMVVASPHSIYPVIDGNPDKLLGVVYLKDLFANLDSDKFALRDLIRQAKFFHEQTEVYNVLEQLREEHLSYGIVCDEFGVTQGVITLKDILEALVGDMLEEKEEPNVVMREDGSLLIDGRCPFYDFLVHVGMEDIYSSAEYNTVSGLVLDLLGHIPSTGEMVYWNDYRLEVVDMDGARIDKILIKRTA